MGLGSCSVKYDGDAKLNIVAKSGRLNNDRKGDKRGDRKGD